MKNSHNAEHRGNKEGKENGVRKLVTTELPVKEVWAGREKSASHTGWQKIEEAQTGQSKFIENFNLHTLFTYKVTDTPSPCPLSSQVHYLMIPT